MAWLKKWWKLLSVSVVVGLGAVAALVSRNPNKSRNTDFEDLHDKQKEQNLGRITDVSERLEDAQVDLEVAETKKGDYSDAKNAVDSFNSD